MPYTSHHNRKPIYPVPTMRKCGDVFFIPRGEDRGVMPRHVEAIAVRIGQTEIRSTAFCVNGFGMILAFKPFAIDHTSGETRNYNMGGWYALSFDSADAELEWNPDPAEPDLTALLYV